MTSAIPALTFCLSKPVVVMIVVALNLCTICCIIKKVETSEKIHSFIEKEIQLLIFDVADNVGDR